MTVVNLWFWVNFVVLGAVFSAIYLDKENYQRNQSSPGYLVLYVN